MISKMSKRELQPVQGRMLCPHGLPIEKIEIGGVSIFVHPDGRSCDLINSLSGSVEGIIAAATAGINAHAMAASLYFFMESLGKYFDTVDRSRLLSAVMALDQIYRHRDISVYFPLHISEKVKDLLTDIFVEDFATSIIPMIIGEFPEENKYVKKYGINRKNAEFYYEDPNNWWMYENKDIKAWVEPLVLFKPLRPDFRSQEEYYCKFVNQLKKDPFHEYFKPYREKLGSLFSVLSEKHMDAFRFQELLWAVEDQLYDPKPVVKGVWQKEDYIDMAFSKEFSFGVVHALFFISIFRESEKFVMYNEFALELGDKKFSGTVKSSGYYPIDVKRNIRITIELIFREFFGKFRLFSPLNCKW